MTSTQEACRVVSYLSLRTGEGASVVPHSLGSTGIFKHNMRQQFELIYKASLKEHRQLLREMKKNPNSYNSRLDKKVDQETI